MTNKKCRLKHSDKDVITAIQNGNPWPQDGLTFRKDRLGWVTIYRAGKKVWECNSNYFAAHFEVEK